MLTTGDAKDGDNVEVYVLGRERGKQLSLSDVVEVFGLFLYFGDIVQSLLSFLFGFKNDRTWLQPIATTCETYA